MSRRKSRNKKQNPTSILKRRIVGLTVSWFDDSPAMDCSGFTPGEVTHKNPVHNIGASQLYGRHKDFIVKDQPLLWRITMTLVFCYPNGLDQREVRELEAYIVLTDLSSHTEEQFFDAMKYGGKDCYSHTEFVVECLGCRPVEVVGKEAA